MRIPDGHPGGWDHAQVVRLGDSNESGMPRRVCAWLVLLGGLCLLCGCASPPPKPQVTVDEVVAMSKQGTPPQVLVEKMRDSRSVYRLPASKLLELKREGISDDVLNYMEQTYLTEACRQAIWDDRGHLYTARTIEGCN